MATRVDWVDIGSEVMHAARIAKGLSFEAVARKMNVSTKTCTRYEKRGQVPRHMVLALAEALTLAVQVTALESVTLDLAEVAALAVALAPLDTVTVTVVDTATGPPKDHEDEVARLRAVFAEHLFDVLSRPAPYCDCPHAPMD